MCDLFIVWICHWTVIATICPVVFVGHAGHHFSSKWRHILWGGVHEDEVCESLRIFMNKHLVREGRSVKAGKRWLVYVRVTQLLFCLAAHWDIIFHRHRDTHGGLFQLHVETINRRGCNDVDVSLPPPVQSIILTRIVKAHRACRAPPFQEALVYVILL